MDEEHEELDWGHDDDELAGSNVLEYPRSDAEGVDVEDVVSLGGDDDDIQEYADYSNTPLQGSGKSAPPSRAYSRSESRGGRRDADREPSIGTRRQSPTPLLSPNHGRSRSQQQLKHALPPKPVVASPAFPIPSTTAASPMSMARREKERRDAVADSQPPPPGWEVRQSRRGDVYFYNPETKESQWTRPAAPKPKAVELSPPSRGRPIILHERLVNGDSWVAAIDGKDTSPRVAGASHSKLSGEDPSSFSYDDRHYRPGDAPHASHPDLSPRLVSTRNEGALPLQPETGHHNNIASRLGHREHSPSRETNGRSAVADDRLRPVDSVYRSRPLDHGSHTTYTASRADSPPPRQSAAYDRERHYRADDDPHHSQGAIARHRSISPAQNSGRYSAPRPRSKSPPRMDTWTPATSSHRPSERDREHDYGSARSPPPPTSRQESTRRPASPPPRVRPSPPVRQRDTYIPADLAVPSRRARDPEMSRYDEENEAKRRRTSDMRSNDSAPARRTVAPETVITPSVTRTSLSSSGHGAESYPSPSADQARSRKRLPLPPQQARFREMSSATPAKRPDQPAPPIPPRSPPASRLYAPLPSEPLASRSAPRTAARDPPPHKPLEDFADMPRLSLPTPPDSHSRLPPPDSSSGRGLRGGRERDRDDERMDVDPSDSYTSKRPPYDEPRARRDAQPASYPPRDDIVSRDPVPRAPRAMGRERERDSGYEGVRRGSGSPTAPTYSRRESTTSVVAEAASSRARDRERERERSPVAPSTRYREPPVAPTRPPVEPARERESVRASYDRSTRAEASATAPSIPREPARAPRRTLDNQVPKLSGTNNVPIGPRKVQAPTIPTSVPAQRPSPPVGRRESTSGAPWAPSGWDRMERQPPPHMPVHPVMDEDAPSGKRRSEEMNAVQMSPHRTRTDTRVSERASRFGPPPLAAPASSSPPVARDGRPLTPEDEYPPRRRASPLPLRSQAARAVGASTSSLDENFIHQTARLRASDPDVRPPPPPRNLSPPPMRERSPPRRERERSPPFLRERSSPRSERSLPPLSERSLPRRDRSPPPPRQRSPPPYVLPRRGSNLQERGGDSYVPVYDKDTPPRTSPNIRGRDRSLPRDLPPHKLARHDSLASRPPYQADRERERERAPQRALTPPLSKYPSAVEDPSVRGADAPAMSYRSRIDTEEPYKYRGMADADLHNDRAPDYPPKRLENEKVDGRNGNVALLESESLRDAKPKGISLLSRLSSDMLPSKPGRDEDSDVGMDEMDNREEKRVNGIRDRGDGPSEVPAFVSGANGGGGAEGRGRGRRRSGKPRRGRR